MTLVPLTSSGTSSGGRAPVFLIHGVNGTALGYRTLAARLGGDRPCIAIEARGVDGRQEPLDCVVAMAAAYVDDITAHAPPRPWLLAGWSFGGLVAFEMAVQLARAGERVAAAIIDTRALLAPTDPANDAPTAPAPGAPFLAATAAAHLKARARYRPVATPAPLLVIRASDGEGAGDRTLGFGRYASGALRVEAIAASHDSLLTDHAEATAAALRAFLAEIDGAPA